MARIRTGSSNYDAPDIPPGTYRMTCVGFEEITLTWENQDVDRFKWTFITRRRDGTEVEIEKLTDPTKTGPKSMNWTLLSALLGPENVGPDMEFDDTELIGKSGLGTMGIPMKPDGQPGKFGLVGMVPLPQDEAPPANGRAAKPAATVSPKRQAQPSVRQQVAAVVDDDETDLPF